MYSDSNQTNYTKKNSFKVLMYSFVNISLLFRNPIILSVVDNSIGISVGPSLNDSDRSEKCVRSESLDVYLMKIK